MQILALKGADESSKKITTGLKTLVSALLPLPVLSSLVCSCILEIKIKVWEVDLKTSKFFPCSAGIVWLQCNKIGKESVNTSGFIL